MEFKVFTAPPHELCAGLHQKRSRRLVSHFRNPAHSMCQARFKKPRCEPEIGADTRAFPEPARLANRSVKGQCANGTHTGYLHESAANIVLKCDPSQFSINALLMMKKIFASAQEVPEFHDKGILIPAKNLSDLSLRRRV